MIRPFWQSVKRYWRLLTALHEGKWDSTVDELKPVQCDQLGLEWLLIKVPVSIEMFVVEKTK